MKRTRMVGDPLGANEVPGSVHVLVTEDLELPGIRIRQRSRFSPAGARREHSGGGWIRITPEHRIERDGRRAQFEDHPHGRRRADRARTLRGSVGLLLPGRRKNGGLGSSEGVEPGAVRATHDRWGSQSGIRKHTRPSDLVRGGLGRGVRQSPGPCSCGSLGSTVWLVGGGVFLGNRWLQGVAEWG